MKAAVVGAGVSGLVAAYTLANAGAQVVVYEAEAYAGGHSRTDFVDGIGLDLGFMVFNRVTYPNMVALFEDLGVDMETSDMSFAVSLDSGRGCEWGSTGLSGLFAQKSNIVNPHFLRMVREILRFKADVVEYLNKVDDMSDGTLNETLGHFLQSRGYSEKFKNCYLVPVCASIWSCSSQQVLGFSAASVLRFCKNHHLLQLFGRPQWLTVKNRSVTYVQKIVAELERMGSVVRLGCRVSQVTPTTRGGVLVKDDKGDESIYDNVIVAAHAPDALTLLGEAASYEERRILGAFQYSYSDLYLHRDVKFMPKNRSAWSAWNFLGNIDGRVCVTYWLNLLQNLGDTDKPFLVTLNPASRPENAICKWSTGHPVPSPAAAIAQTQLHTIQGKKGVWYCGAYQGYGFHEDGVKSGLAVAKSILGLHYTVLENVKQMTFTWYQTLARTIVTTFLRKFIVAGRIELLEDGGTIFVFEGDMSTCKLQSKLRIHSPGFYVKLATRSDLGLAEAYMDGDYTCLDSENGLLNLLMVLVENRDIMRRKEADRRRGWWTPMFVSSALASATSYTKYRLRKNTISNARQNISEHYDLSNDLFSLFLDETMTYSCAIFQGPSEPLKDAQLRKLHHIIEKARISSTDEVLEIGFGWGSMAIEVVRITGCRYTGISLSQEQLTLARKRVHKAGLEDKITFKLCDYRALEGRHKYDRIISCEMLEAVGHEYYEEFFKRCDYLLAKDGLMVVQVISVPDERYDELLKSSEFIKEYMFPGGSLPCLAVLTAAMSKASKFCIEHLENIGVHYVRTLLEWRKNFHLKRAELKKLGFNEKFLKKWDYYFVYCAAGFKSCTLGNLQIVFSRPGNVKVLGHTRLSID